MATGDPEVLARALAKRQFDPDQPRRAEVAMPTPAEQVAAVQAAMAEAEASGAEISFKRTDRKELVLRNVDPITGAPNQELVEEHVLLVRWQVVIG